MASIWPRTRCSSPKATTCSTASKTFSHEVRNASAVSFHDRGRAPASARIGSLRHPDAVGFHLLRGSAHLGDHVAATALHVQHRAIDRRAEAFVEHACLF